MCMRSRSIIRCRMQSHGQAESGMRYPQIRYANGAYFAGVLCLEESPVSLKAQLNALVGIMDEV